MIGFHVETEQPMNDSSKAGLAFVAIVCATLIIITAIIVMGVTGNG